jgi:hypothetical protein
MASSLGKRKPYAVVLLSWHVRCLEKGALVHAIMVEPLRGQEKDDESFVGVKRLAGSSYITLFGEN